MKKLFDPDLLGTAASILCLIHCLLMPWLLMISGAWLSQYVTHPYFHHIMLVAAIAIGLPIFIKSYVKYNSKTILFLGCMGLSITSYGTFKYDPCLNKSINVIADEAPHCSSCAVSPEETNNSDVVTLDKPSTLQTVETKMAAYVVPFGVVLILFAHVLNFRHRKSCRKTCCPSQA